MSNEVVKFDSLHAVIYANELATQRANDAADNVKLQEESLNDAIDDAYDSTDQAVNELQTKDQQVQDAISEALSQSDVNPDYVSYDVGVLPDSTGASTGTIGAYFKDSGTFQKLEWDGTSWQEIGRTIQAGLGFVSVAWYGAVSDGTTDNTTAVQNALNDGEVVYIPLNTYYDRSQLDVPPGKYILDNSTGVPVTSQDPWWKPEPTDLILTAHRGYAELAPENTMAAFSNAYYVGADAIECDVNFTSDGEPVIMHDDTVDRTTDGTGNVSDLTLSEVRALDAGSWYHSDFEGCKVPTLDEVLEYSKGRFQVRVELKSTVDNTEIDTVLQKVKEHGLENTTLISSFSLSKLQYARSQNKNVGIVLLGASVNQLDDMSKLGGRVWMSMDNSTLLDNPEYVQQIRDRGVDVTALPTLDETTALKLMEIGVMSISSDIGILTDKAYSGSTIAISEDFGGFQKTEATPGAISASNGRLTVSSDDTDRNALYLDLPLQGGDLIEVDFYAKSDQVSGVLGTWIDEDTQSGTSLNNLYVHNDDILRYRFRKYITRERNPGVHQLYLGTSDPGTLEMFDVNVRVTSQRFAGTRGVFGALLYVDSGSVTFSNNSYSYGIQSVELDAEGKIKVTVPHGPHFLKNFQATTSTGNPAIVTIGGYSSSSSGDTFSIKAFDFDGTAIDLSTVSDMFINILG